MVETVSVYIRLGAHDEERLFSFKRPDSIPTAEMLEKGLAIDGDQVVFAVAPSRLGGYDHPFIEAGTMPSTTLPEALHEAETGLIAWLGEHSYEVDFE